MPVNALIPMSFQPTQGVGVDIGSALQDARQGWDIERSRQAQLRTNALKDIFSQPGAIGPDGQPTRDTLQKVWAASPDMGMNLQQNMLNDQYRALQARMMQSKFFGEKHDMEINAQGAAWNAYRDVFERTHNQEQAMKAGQDTLTRERQPIVEGGLGSPQEVAALPPFDPTYSHAVSGTPTQQESEELRREQMALVEQQREATRERLQYYPDVQLTPLKGGDPIMARQDRTTREWVTSPDNTPIDINQYKKYEKGDYIPAGQLYGPEVIQSLVKRYMAGDPNVLQELRSGGFGGPARATNAAAFEKELTEQMKDKPPSEIAMSIARFKALTREEGVLAQQKGNLDRVYTELTEGVPGTPSEGGFVNQVLKTSANVPRTGWIPLNRLGEAIQLQGGGENIVKLKVALQGFQTAYASAFSRGGGQTPVYAMQHADEILRAAFSKGQIKAGVDQLMSEIDIAKQAPGIAMEDAIKVYQARQEERATGAAQSSMTNARGITFTKEEGRNFIRDQIAKDPKHRDFWLDQAREKGIDTGGL